MTLDVEDVSDGAEWRAYCQAAPEGSLFHDARWIGAVEKAYGYRCFQLVARRAGAVAGILPLTLVSSPLLGRSLISVAFGTGGGILADDEEASRALAARAVELGRQFGVKYVELRGGAAPGEGYGGKTGLHASFVKTLPENADAILSFLPRARRAEVRKALASEEAGDLSLRLTDDIGDFYKLYAATLRDHGTPVMPKKFIAALKANFGEEAEIAALDHRGEPVAALMSFWRESRVMPYYVGAGAKARELRAYDHLYYSLMRRAVEKGVRVFDFGRSKVGSTHYATKTHWGFEPAPVVYHTALLKTTTQPNLSPANPKFGSLVSIWRRLPLPVANALGPIVARNFP